MTAKGINNMNIMVLRCIRGINLKLEFTNYSKCLK